MSSWTSTNVGALTTTYTATWAGGDCNSVYLAANDVHPSGWLQRGGPGEEDQQSCLPPNWTREAIPYYSPGICPSGFSIATQGEAGGVSTATCCPTEYHARLTATSIDKNICSSVITAPSSESILFTNFDDGAPASTTLYTFTGGTYVGARGVVIQRQSTDPPWDPPTASPTESSSSPSSSSPTGGNNQAGDGGGGGEGLTTGAKAGIGVGVSLGVLLILSIIFAAFKISRSRRQEHQQQQQLPMEQQPQFQHTPYPSSQGTTKSGYRSSPHQDWTPSRPYQPIQELNSMASPTELESNTSAANELEGSRGWK